MHNRSPLRDYEGSIGFWAGASGLGFRVSLGFRVPARLVRARKGICTVVTGTEGRGTYIPTVIGHPILNPHVNSTH